MEKDNVATRWFQFPFRIFFLSVAIWGLIVIPLWLAEQVGHMNAFHALPGIVWHQHEMIFGLLMPAIAGFLLTAVCVWTKTERTHGWWLFGMWVVWLLGRLSITWGQALPYGLVAGINLLFTPLVAVDAGRRVFLRKQWRQLPILLVLTLLFVTQAIVLLLPAAQTIYKLHALHAALVATCGIMMIIGGRITPAFSKNWLNRQDRTEEAERIENPNWLQYLALALLVLLTVLVAANVKGAWVASVAVLAAIACLVRILLWRGWYTITDPLLWILHLSLLWIPLGLFLLAGSSMHWWGSNAWSHAIGVGAMFSLIIGVMTRVSLGHTGRKMELPKGQVAAYVLIQLGAVVRVATAMGWLPQNEGLIASGTMWALALVIFLVPYSVILSVPRVDGKPG